MMMMTPAKRLPCPSLCAHLLPFDINLEVIVYDFYCRFSGEHGHSIWCNWFISFLIAFLNTTKDGYWTMLLTVFLALSPPFLSTMVNRSLGSAKMYLKCLL